jgi:WD40 repeat protein
LDHPDSIQNAGFVSDGSLLVTGSLDNEARVWFAQNRFATPVSVMHQDEIRHVATSSIASMFATAQGDGLVRVFQFEPVNNTVRTEVLADQFSRVHFTGNGRFMMCIAPGKAVVQIQDIETGQVIRELRSQHGPVTCGCFTPDDDHVVLGIADTPDESDALKGRVVCMNWQKEEEVFSADTRSRPLSVAAQPRGTGIAIVCADGDVRVIDGASASPFWVSRTVGTQAAWHQRPEEFVVFAPDGATLATLGHGYSVRVWDARTGQLRFPPLSHSSECRQAAFSPDGKIIATASVDQTVKLWNAKTGQLITGPLRHTGWVHRVRFSSDSRYVVTSCSDKRARVWDCNTGQLLAPPVQESNWVLDAVFLPDQRSILTSSWGGTATFWQWKTGRRLAPTITEVSDGHQCAVAPGGTHAIICGNGLVTICYVKKFIGNAESRSVESLRGYAEVISGRRLYAGSSVENMTTEEWYTRWTNWSAERRGSAVKYNDDES